MTVGVDSGEFLGRADERRRWGTILQESRRASKEDRRSFVVLVHGIGGMGKSQLTSRLVEIAAGKVDSGSQGRQPAMSTVLIDLEAERQRLPDKYPAIVGPSIGTLLYTIERAVCECLGKPGEAAFANFRSVLASILDLVNNQDRVRMEREHEGSQLSEREISGLEEAAILVAGLAGVTISGGTAAAAVGAGFGLARVAGRLWSKGRADAPVPQSRIDLILDPEKSLVTAFAEGMRKVSGKRGLVVAIDTAEIAEQALAAIRNAAKLSGGSVVWLIAGRFDIPAESGYGQSAVARFEREIGDDRLAVIAISVFDRLLQDAYLKSRLGREFDEEDLAKLDAVTRGIPLALQLVVGMLRDGETLDDLYTTVGEQGEPNRLVKGLAERFLHHALHGGGQGSEALRADLPAIFGLVADETAEAGKVIGFDLQRQIVASLLDVDPARLRERLDELAKRHDFVLAGTGRVHQEVSSVLSKYLLGPDQRSTYRDMHERAVAVIRAEIARRNESLNLGGRTADGAWRVLASALVRHEFWISNERGIRALANLLPQAVVLQPTFSDLLWSTARPFFPTASEAERNLLGEMPGKNSRLLREIRREVEPATTGESHPGAAFQALRTVDADPELGCDPHARSCLLELLAAGEAEAAKDWEKVYAHALNADSIPEVDDPAIGAAIGTYAEKAASGLTFAGEFSQRSDLGLAACRLALKHKPESVEVKRMLGISLRETGKFEEGLKELREAVAIDDGSPYVHHTLAITLRMTEEYSDAVDSHKKAIELMPTYAHAYTAYGQTQSLLGQYDEALANHEEAVRLAPASSASHGGLSTVLVDLGLFDKGLAAAEKAIELGPSVPWPHSQRASALERLGRGDEALASIEDAIRLTPDSGWLLYRRGTILGLDGRPEEGVEALREAARLHGGVVETWGMLGALHRTMGRKEGGEDAVEAFESALESNSFSEHPVKRTEWRAISRAVLGDPKAGIKEMASVKIRPPAWSYDPRLYTLLRRKPFEGLTEIEGLVKRR